MIVLAFFKPFRGAFPLSHYIWFVFNFWPLTTIQFYFLTASQAKLTIFSMQKIVSQFDRFFLSSVHSSDRKLI